MNVVRVGLLAFVAGACSLVGLSLPGCSLLKPGEQQAIEDTAVAACHLVQIIDPSGLVLAICATVEEIDMVTRELNRKPTDTELVHGVMRIRAARALRVDAGQ